MSGKAPLLSPLEHLIVTSKAKRFQSSLSGHICLVHSLKVMTILTRSYHNSLAQVPASVGPSQEGKDALYGDKSIFPLVSDS